MSDPTPSADAAGSVARSQPTPPAQSQAHGPAVPFVPVKQVTPGQIANQATSQKVAAAIAADTFKRSREAK